MHPVECRDRVEARQCKIERGHIGMGELCRWNMLTGQFDMPRRMSTLSTA
jgi:hypothetical protein